MKRDMNLVQYILETIEADPTPFRLNDGWTEGIKVELDDVPIYDLAHHILLLGTEGFIVLGSDFDIYEPPLVLRMTWKGYDLLDSLRVSKTIYRTRNQ